MLIHYQYEVICWETVENADRFEPKDYIFLKVALSGFRERGSSV